MRRRIMAEWIAPALILLAWLSHSTVLLASPDNAYASVYECVFKAKLPKKTCIDAFDDAYDVYRERAPRYKTRAACNAVFKVCVVFNPPAYGGRPPPPITPADVTYAPPLLGVILSPEGDALQVLLDTTRKPLGGGVPQRYSPAAKASPPGFAGTNFAPPTGTFVPRERRQEQRYPDAIAPMQGLFSGDRVRGNGPIDAQIDAPGPTSLDGVSSYPVPENRRRHRP